MKLVRMIGLVCIAAGMLIFLTPQIRQAQLKQELVRLRLTEAAKEQDDTAEDESEAEQEEQRESTADTDAAAGKKREETGGTKEDLYEQMESYNRTLVEKGQEIAGPEAYEQNPIGEDGPIGSVRIPDMGVELPLYLGATYEHLDQGAAVLGGTSMPVGGVNTNCVISGHRSWCGAPYFRDIDLLKAGSRVMINNGRETLCYRVFETRIILPDNTEAVMIQPGKDMVTLITCHPYLGGGTHRYVVYCERWEEEDESETELMEEFEKNQTGVQGAERMEHAETADRKGDERQEKETAKLIWMEHFVRRAAAAIMITAGAAALLAKCGKKRRK